MDPNQLGADPGPDPDSHVPSDPVSGTEQDPNKFGSRYGSGFLKLLK